MREVYSASSHYAESSFFDHFTVFDERPLFSVTSPIAYREKRRLIASFYHNLSINKLGVEELVRERVDAFLGQIDRNLQVASVSMDFYLWRTTSPLTQSPVYFTDAATVRMPSNVMAKSVGFWRT